ncbi:MAG: HAD-IA family hydrolase [Gammaproteobacteria bacterium]|nr:HAD-IA family hydrolase [Gammaproteobacteria bacterium]
MPDLRADDYDILSFDCYGTLVDWESAIIQYLQPVLLSHDVHVFDGTILEFYSEWEPLEQDAGGTYRDVLSRVMTRYGARLGFTPTGEETEGFITAIASSSPFEDTVDAMTKLSEHFKFAIISNTDEDLIQQTLELIPTEFSTVLTAQELGAYKPDREMMRNAFDQISQRDKRILHVAQSKYHDILPASELGLNTVWINRSSEHASAVQGVEATPVWEFENLADFAAIFD